MTRFYLTLALAFCTGFLFDAVAQRPTDDVLYLKNGWVLRGRLLPATAPETVSIHTNDGNTFVFPQADVLQTKQEPALRYLNIRYRDRGYAHFTELGVMASNNNVNQSGVTTSAFTFHTVNGYKFSQWLYTGLGAGVDLYASQTFIPVFASLRGDFTRKGILIPYYYVDGGWGFNGTTNTPTRRQRGGVHFAAGVDMKVLFNGNAGFLLSVGYYLQQTAIEEIHDGGTRRTEDNYRRVAIRAGFAF